MTVLRSNGFILWCSVQDAGYPVSGQIFGPGNRSHLIVFLSGCRENKADCTTCNWPTIVVLCTGCLISGIHSSNWAGYP